MGHKVANVSFDGTNYAEHGSSSNPAAASPFAQLSFAEVLEDLSSRFIVNLPAEELASIERICFQVEQAHWFYEDFLRPLNPSLTSFSLRRFSSYLLHTSSLTVPLIQRYISTSSGQKNQQDLEAAFDEFMKYKTRVPVCGVVMLNHAWDKCVLVKGWKSSAAWGFPKGKINQQESERDCAVREVLEETGFDCDSLLAPDSSDFMELTMREQKIRLYIVPGVDEGTHFETLTRKEISRIAWFKLSDLPTWKKNRAPPQGMGGKFYLISPFIGKLKQWIQENRQRKQTPAISDTMGIMGTPHAEKELDVQSGGLKLLLGLGNGKDMPPTAKGPQMIEEQGDARSRQLLDLLRTGSSDEVAGEAREVSSSSPQPPLLDERERGTAALLAALNAGAGKAMEVPLANGSSNSAALLSMLNGGPPPAQATSAGVSAAPYQRLSSPLPAPHAQNTSQSQSLLRLISPAVESPQSAEAEDKDRERSRQRDALLSGLMASSLSVRPPSVHQEQKRVEDFRFPSVSASTPTSLSKQENLLSLLNGGLQATAQAPPLSASPFSTFVQQAHQDSAPQYKDQNPLLAMLNKNDSPSRMPPPPAFHPSPFHPPPASFPMNQQNTTLPYPPPPPPPPHLARFAPPPPHMYSLFPPPPPPPQGPPIYPPQHLMGPPGYMQPQPPSSSHGYLPSDHRPVQNNAAMDALARLLPS